MRAKNEIRFEGQVAYLALAYRGGEDPGEVRLDAADAERVLALSERWYVQKTTPPYARAWVRDDKGYRHISLHRFLSDASAGAVVDHINEDWRDNRRVNLRHVTPSQNLQNRSRANRGNQCGVKNVTFLKGSGTYWVRIRSGGKLVNCGVYATLEDAAAAATAARRRLHTHCPENRPVQGGAR